MTCWHGGGGRSKCKDGGGWHANGVRHGGGGDGSSSGQQQQWHAVGTACARVWARQGEGVPAAAQGVFSGGRQGWAAVGRKGGEVLVESGSGAAWRYAGCLFRLSRGLIRRDSPLYGAKLVSRCDRRKYRKLAARRQNFGLPVVPLSARSKNWAVRTGALTNDRSAQRSPRKVHRTRNT